MAVILTTRQGKTALRRLSRVLLGDARGLRRNIGFVQERGAICAPVIVLGGACTESFVYSQRAEPRIMGPSCIGHSHCVAINAQRSVRSSKPVMPATAVWLLHSIACVPRRLGPR